MNDTGRTLTGKRSGFISPVAEFLAAETTGALVLLIATAAALAWANSPAAGSYHELWETDLAFRLGEATLVSLDLRHWVNEGLMVLFFFVVGLEVKRQLVDGELADRRKATLPIVAALGGMIVPALIYTAFNAGGPGYRGWGIPIATDIAVALGLLALLGRGAPAALRIFLLSVAIADDIGSIVVIAAFYSGQIDTTALVLAVILLLVVVGLWKISAFWSDPPLVVLMAGVWAAVLASGVHPTIAGVALGLITPAGPSRQPSPAERLEHSLHPWTSYLVIPVFALANAGIAIDASGLGAAMSSPVTVGVVLGLVLGKLVGVSAGAYIAVRTGLGLLPNGVSWPHIVSAAALAGIGYTVSLFIASLSFADTQVGEEAKIGILLGSLSSAVLGAILLRLSLRKAPPAVQALRSSRATADAITDGELAAPAGRALHTR